MPSTNPLVITLTLAAVLVAATCHEFAHAFVADRLGDPTARDLGRLSLNPLVHLDLLGTLFFVLFGFGWARPVPVNPRNFQSPRQGMLQVAVAGPLANVTVAFLVGVLVKSQAPDGGLLGFEFAQPGGCTPSQRGGLPASERRRSGRQEPHRGQRIGGFGTAVGHKT